MSPVDSDVLDAVQHMLESNGALQNIRAQLKSSVVNVLRDKSDINAHLKVPEAARVYMTEEGTQGAAKMSLIVEFMKNLGMEHSASIFMAESGLESSHWQTREEALHNLGLPPSFDRIAPKAPLLDNILSGVRNRASEIGARGRTSEKYAAAFDPPARPTSADKSLTSRRLRDHLHASPAPSDSSRSSLSSPAASPSPSILGPPNNSSPLTRNDRTDDGHGASPKTLPSMTQTFESSPSETAQSKGLSPSYGSGSDSNKSSPSSFRGGGSPKDSRMSLSSPSDSPSSTVSPRSLGSRRGMQLSINASSTNSSGIVPIRAEDKLSPSTGSNAAADWSGRKSPTSQLAPVSDEKAVSQQASPSSGVRSSPMDAKNAKHSPSPSSIDMLLSVDTRSRHGRMGSLEPLSSSSPNISPPVSPSNAAVLGKGPSVFHDGRNNKRSSPSGKSSAGAVRLDDSLDSVASFGSMSGSFDKSSSLSSPSQLNPISAGTKATTTHSKSHALRRGDKAEDRTRVVEVTSAPKERADAKASRANAATSRSKSGWGSSAAGADDNVFIDNSSPNSKSLNQNSDSSMTSSSPNNKTLNETVETYQSSNNQLEESNSSLPSVDNSSPSPSQTPVKLGENNAAFAKSPTARMNDAYSPRSVSSQNSHGVNTNNSTAETNSIEYDDYGDDGFEDEEAALEESVNEKDDFDYAGAIDTKGQDSIYEASFESAGAFSEHSNRGNNKSSSRASLDEARGANSTVSDVIAVEDLEASVASEELDDFEVSTGGMSDSFGLLNESQNSNGSKSRMRRIIAARQAGASANANVSNNSALSKQPSNSSLDDSHQSFKSEGMEFSVSESEVTSSQNFDNYDFATNALPPLKDQGVNSKRKW